MACSEQKKMQETLAQIAAKHLGIETLEPRRRDSLDFHEVGVWGVKTALEAAYEAGRQDARPKSARELVAIHRTLTRIQRLGGPSDPKRF